MNDPAAVAVRDQEKAAERERRRDEVAFVEHEAALTAARFKALRKHGITASRAFTLTRDWHSATFCEGVAVVTVDDCEPA